MKRMILFTLMAAAALFAACGAPPENKPVANANVANANMAKPANAAPTKDDLVALDKQANEAWKNHDTKFFETFLDDKFLGYGATGRSDKATALKEIAGHKCDVKSFTMDDPQMKMIGADVAVLVYKLTVDGTCAGHPVQPARAASVLVRKGDKWLGAYHSETNIVEPKAPATADKKQADAKPDTKKDTADTKKDTAGAKKDTNTNKNTADAKKEATDSKASDMKATDSKASDAKPGPDPMLDALMAVEKAGWDAWKERDAKKLDDLTTKDISFVDAMGMYYADKASTLKAWTEPKCDIKSVNVADGHSVMLTNDVALLLYKGTAAGTCEGQKLGALWGSTVVQKDGDAWKAAFIAELPAH